MNRTNVCYASWIAIIILSLPAVCKTWYDCGRRIATQDAIEAFHERMEGHCIVKRDSPFLPTEKQLGRVSDYLSATNEYYDFETDLRYLAHLSRQPEPTFKNVPSPSLPVIAPDYSYTGIEEYEKATDNSYHEFGTLSDGSRWGSKGSLTYLIDKEGCKLSRGYHEITPIGNGEYEGQLGAGKTRFHLK